MNHASVADCLNHLIEINKDAEAGFLSAAENVRNSEVETLFTGYASRHAAFVAELAAEITRIGEEPVRSGTAGGALHRGWLNLKSTLSGRSAGSMLSACDTAEQSAESAYLDAENVITSGKAHTLIAAQCEQIQGFRKRLNRLVDEIKDGVEFQKNE